MGDAFRLGHWVTKVATSLDALVLMDRKDHLNDMVKVTVGMEAIWQEQDLSINEEEAKAELELAMQQARQSGEKMDEERLAAQVYEAVKV